LRSCLKAVYAQVVTFAYQVIVVDTGSDAGELKLLQRDYPDTHWLLIKHQNPYTARNHGISSSTTRFVALLDAKCRPRTDWLQRLMDHAAEAPEGSIITGKYEVRPKTSHKDDLIYGLLYLINERNVKNHYGIPAGQLLVHRKTFERIGYFNDESHTGSDIAWSLKALSHGISIDYVPLAIVEYPGQSFDELMSSLKKYAFGILKADAKNATTLSILTNTLRYMMPQKIGIFRQAIIARGLNDLSWRDKYYLWKRVWLAKRILARAYFSHWMNKDN